MLINISNCAHISLEKWEKNEVKISIIKVEFRDSLQSLNSSFLSVTYVFYKAHI